VKEAVYVWLVTQPKTFFPVAIQKTKCVEKSGVYTEKCYCALTLIVLFNKNLIADAF
jgi:hypothetical protein